MDRYRTLLEVNNAVINCLGQAQLEEATAAVLRRVMPCDEACLAFSDAVSNERRGDSALARLRGLSSHLTAPLVVQGASIGELGVGSAQPSKYQAEDLRLLQDIAAQVALTAANVRAYEECRALGPQSVDGSLVDLERRYIAATLERCRWVIEGSRGAAKALGLHPNTLRHRLRKLELKRPSKEPG
jgi:GAF domain-containing protein